MTKSALFLNFILIIIIFFLSHRQVQAFDLDAFDDPGLDRSSNIMQLFQKKNKRILNIFRNSDKEDEIDVSLIV